MKLFRFQDMEIWKRAVQIGVRLYRVADGFEKQGLFAAANQIWSAALSNNIAEGSGSASRRDFANFLNIARRSAVENANMLLFHVQEGSLTSDAIQPLLTELAEECRMIEAFRKTLKATDD